MAKTNNQGLGKNIADPEARKRFLKDNCDAVEQKTYMKPFTPEQLQGRKEALANAAIQINDIEDEAKAIAKDFKDQLKPLKEKRNQMIADIRNKAELVTEQCYRFVDPKNPHAPHVHFTMPHFKCSNNKFESKYGTIH